MAKIRFVERRFVSRLWTNLIFSKSKPKMKKLYSILFSYFFLLHVPAIVHIIPSDSVPSSHWLIIFLLIDHCLERYDKKQFFSDSTTYRGIAYLPHFELIVLIYFARQLQAHSVIFQRRRAAASRARIRDRFKYDFHLFVTWIISGGNVPWPEPSREFYEHNYFS